MVPGFRSVRLRTIMRRLALKAVNLSAISLVWLFFAPLALRAAAEDISGEWDLKVETSQGTGNPSVSLQQQGEKITGTYRGRMGETALEGTFRDSDLRFSVRLKFRDQEHLVTYTGRVNGDSMSGTVQFGDAGSGKWTASRKNAGK